MKTRLNVAIENYKREQERLKRKKKECEWYLEKGQNTEQTRKIVQRDLESYRTQLRLITRIINDLEWIGRGEA